MKKKKAIANRLMPGCGMVDWDDLPDVNSLHDCESIEDIEYAVQERLEDSGFPLEAI